MSSNLRRKATFGVVAVLLAIATVSCGHRTAQGSHPVPPRYPNVFGTAVAEHPDNDGELFVPRHGDVTLTLSDGRRLVVPSSVKTPGATGLLCRTTHPARPDGTYAPPCRLQAFVARGRADWIDVIGEETVGTAVSGSDRWLVLSDGTALPLPLPPRHVVVNCRDLGTSNRVKFFTRTHQLVRVSVRDDGTLVRVDCVSSTDYK